MGTDFCWTAKEVADLLECSVARVNQMRNHGLINGVKFGKSYLYSGKELEQLISDASLIPIYVMERVSSEQREKMLKLARANRRENGNVNNN